MAWTFTAALLIELVLVLHNRDNLADQELWQLGPRIVAFVLDVPADIMDAAGN